MKKYIILIIVWIIPMGSLYASQVSFEPLEDIAGKAEWIIKAKVSTVDSRGTADTKHIVYAVVPTAALAGPKALPKKVEFSYTQNFFNPAIMDAQGQTMGWASVMYSGSGNEFLVKADQEWIFLLPSNVLSKSEATEILRVEPLSREIEIRKLVCKKTPESCKPQR